MATFEELVSKILLRLDRNDGRARLATEESINDALKYIARVKDFDELMVLDTTNAATVIDTKLYHLVDDWGLTRPKSLYTLRYMDESSSRKLIYVPASRLDAVIPYTEQLGTQRPNWYTRRGDEVELIPIPNAAKSVYIFYSQWPAILSGALEPPYSDLDDVIITLSTDIATGILDKSFGNYVQRARELLGLAVREDITRPDRTFIAQPFQAADEAVQGEYWLDPFIQKDP